MEVNLNQNEEYKETELGLLPKDWEVVRLINLVNLQRGSEVGSNNYNKEGKGIRFLRVVDISGSRNELIYTTSENIKKCDKNDVLITFDGSPGLVRRGLCGAFSSGIRKVIIKDNRVLLDYVYYVALTSFVQQTIEKYSTGVTIKHASKSIPHIKIPLPPLSEQKKIAFVLSTVQEAKEKTEDVIKATKELKKSMMKHLFTYGPVPIDEAEHVPLKETELGLLPKDWEVVRLGDVVEIKGGKRLPKGHYFSELPTNYPYIRIVDFANNTVKTTNLKYLTEECRNKIKEYIITKEDVYISIAGTIGLVGTIPFELDGANLTENAARLIIRNSEILYKNYLIYYLSSENGQKEIEIRKTKTSQPKLALMRIKQIQIPLPSLPIQQKIASILSAIDQKIEAEENKKKALEDLFKSVLHHLMTAKVRVKNLNLEVKNE